MRLYTLCKICDTEIHVKPTETTRSELEKEKGERFRVVCQGCAKDQEIHVNQVMAKPSPVLLVAGGVVGVVLAVGLVFVFGLISLGLFSIPFLIWQQQEASARAFNNYRL